MFVRGRLMSKFVVDMIEELKLRRWARLNYRRLEQWDASLDPIVLDELQTIEREAQEANAAAEQTSLTQSGQTVSDSTPVATNSNEFGMGILRQKSA